MDSQLYDKIFEVEETLWWYSGRRTICTGVLERFLGFDRHRRVLDVGCGTGYQMMMLNPFGQVEGVDMSPEALHYCKRRGIDKVQLGSATDLPYPARSFDLLTAMDVIEHVQEDVLALREFFRVLRPGGRLFIYTPALPWLFGVHDRKAHHFRRYARAELLTKLETAGFELEHVSYANLLVLPIVLMVRAVVDRMRNRPYVELIPPPRPINAVLAALCRMEKPLVLGPGLPYGMSLLALARRPEESERQDVPWPEVREQVSA